LIEFCLRLNLQSRAHTGALTRADFFAITAPAEPPAFSLRDAKDIRILFSRAATDAVFDTAINKMH